MLATPASSGLGGAASGSRICHCLRTPGEYQVGTGSISTIKKQYAVINLALIMRTQTKLHPSFIIRGGLVPKKAHGYQNPRMLKLPI